jgi:hypothetical protein
MRCSIGVVSLIAGVGWVIQEYFANVGDAAIDFLANAAVVSILYYCFTRSLPFSTTQIESPNIAFDYVLYGGCLLFGLEVAYIENRFLS